MNKDGIRYAIRINGTDVEVEVIVPERTDFESFMTGFASGFVAVPPRVKCFSSYHADHAARLLDGGKVARAARRAIGKHFHRESAA